jgi:hypothetical protein
MRWRAGLASLLILLVVSAVFAQRRRGFAPERQYRYATLDDFDGSFQFCRLVFRQSRYGDGGGWNVDFPRADENLSVRLSELTKTPIGMDENGIPKHLLVNLLDPVPLSHCPFVMATEVGALGLDPTEAANLRDYLLRGGFLWVDDFWGTAAWENFEAQIRQALPAGSFPIQELSLNHPIFHSQMVVARMPQIPSINAWGGPGGPTSERGYDSATPHARAIVDERGRVMVFITFNTDIGDSFEREGDDRNYFLEFSVHGYALGVNALLYAMTH